MRGSRADGQPGTTRRVRGSAAKHANHRQPHLEAQAVGARLAHRNGLGVALGGHQELGLLAARHSAAHKNEETEHVSTYAPNSLHMRMMMRRMGGAQRRPHQEAC